jgi:maltooligosyltrehalose trehalohydrolase
MGEEYGETAPFPYFCSFLDSNLIEAVRAGRQQEFAHFQWEGKVPDPQEEETFLSAKLSWSWPADSSRAGLRRLYTDLLTARREWPSLRDFEHRSAALIGDSPDNSILVLTRGAGSSDRLTVSFNLSNREQTSPGCPSDAVRLMTSEDPRYGGNGSGDGGGKDRGSDGTTVLQPFEFRVFGPSSWGK